MDHRGCRTPSSWLRGGLLKPQCDSPSGAGTRLHLASRLPAWTPLLSPHPHGCPAEAVLGHCPSADLEWSGPAPTQTRLGPSCQEQQGCTGHDGTWPASWKEMAKLKGLGCEATARLATRKKRVTRGGSPTSPGSSPGGQGAPPGPAGVLAREVNRAPAWRQGDSSPADTMG